MFRFELINILILDNPFGISINISLNSLINGGKTRMATVNMMKDIAIRTINKEIDLGSFNPVWIWLHKLQTTLDITKEQIINRIKSLKVHIIKELIVNTANLK